MKASESIVHTVKIAAWLIFSISNINKQSLWVIMQQAYEKLHCHHVSLEVCKFGCRTQMSESLPAEKSPKQSGNN